MSQSLTFDLNVDNKQAIADINDFFAAYEHGVKGVGKRVDEMLGDKHMKMEIRLENGKPVLQAVKNLASQGNRLEKITDAMNGKFGNTAHEVEEVAKMLKTLASKTAKFQEGTKKLNPEWKAVVQTLKEARKQAEELRIDEKFQRSITGANIAAGLALDAIRGLTGGISKMISEGIKMEVLMIQLKGFTGGTEQANEAFNEFLRIAANTPFNVTQVASAARTMMGFGLSTNDATNRVEQLAIVAAATGGELTHMSRNLGQIQANQRAYTRDLMQFANQGIPIYRILGEVLGVTTQQVRQLAEEGQIGFAEVSAALDKMTEKGSAFKEISDEMDKTVASRIEALQGTITATSGKFIEMFQAVDTALGGPVEKSFKAIIWLVKKLGDGFDLIKLNAEALAPVFAALTVALVGSLGIVAKTILPAIIAGFKLWIAKIMATTVAVNALNATKAVLAALSGQWHLLAAAAVVAAAGVAIYKVATRKAKDETTDLMKELKDEKFSVAAESTKTLVFAMENLTNKQKAHLKVLREEYDVKQNLHNVALGNAERALSWLKNEAEERKKNHTQAITDLKNKVEIEKDGLEQVKSKAKSVHESKMEGLKKELEAVKNKYDLELDRLEEQSVFAKELEQIKRREIQDKLKNGDLDKKETLELKEQLHQMDIQVRRRDLLAQKKKDEKDITDKMLAQEEKHEKLMEKVGGMYEDRITALEKQIATEEKGIKDIDAELKDQADKIKGYKNEELEAIFKNRQEAIASLDAQLIKAGELRDAMIEVYKKAKDARIEWQKTADEIAKATPSRFVSGRETTLDTGGTRASGGPVSGGKHYTVNELGKEAFLSASGRLSMINAPAFGRWRAPSSGTVIPAHLTKQLDVPSGGINLNKAASVNAAQGGGMSGIARAIQGSMRGDIFHQNVTVQAANPVQAANNMMVEMTRFRRRRYG